MCHLSDPATTRIVVATGNDGKMREFARILQPLGLIICKASEMGIDWMPEETGNTFEDNAILKATQIHQAFPPEIRLGSIVLADDSGLEVDALDGAPGVFSARYGGPGFSDLDRCTRLLQDLAEVPEPQRTARFRCVIAALMTDGSVILARGSCPGSIGRAPEGEGGFGYDPIFLPEGFGGRTMAQLAPGEKDDISHRGQALKELLRVLTGEMT
ncbi:MAG TPA: non-canonical purine NTP pyrophosphatase, RdgB/HAM1 family, partial [Clostridiales bacterium]|nr:non-canonical purine NTP pyrophosphatase, RdgB/HAM1 family [Clostridiales bacterium]